MLRLQPSVLVLATLLGGCAGADQDSGSNSASIGDTDTMTDPTATVSDSVTDTADTGGEEICLLHNCESDDECGACTDGRNTCFVEEKRCVACDPTSGEGCADGEECTEFGLCVPEGATCPADNGTECNDDPECAACDPDHQVCSAGACVACRGDMAEACLGTEFCGEDGTCVPKCPADCTTDADCSHCGEDTEQPAMACHNHACAQCSDDHPCAPGSDCSPEGVCVEICGLPGMVPGTCDEDSNCAACPGDSTNCNTPINGGHGECGPTASGCSDLGSGVVVLPEPFDQVTNTCSNDNDCEGVAIEYNVGELLRDITGIDGIGDAIVEYPMGACAAVTVGIGEGSVSCGVCVPCKVDDDCLDIDIDMVAGDAFGDLGAIATALLLDSLFGDEDHLIHMFCQPVAGDYGVCLPCPTVINDCVGNPGGGEGTCDHDTCTEGGPLAPDCGTCAAAVCAVDDYCCTTAWDATCVGEVADNCAGGCDGGGGGGNCHDQCTTGEAMDSSCNACVSSICNNDPFCCQTSWDQTCVDEVADFCDGECGGGGCSHDECSQGGPLEASCSTCATDVCNEDAFCCSTDWDATCVGEADTICGICDGGSACAHSECQTGAPLDEGCSTCAGAICGADPFCCDSNWDSMCVDAAEASGSCPC